MKPVSTKLDVFLDNLQMREGRRVFFNPKNYISKADLDVVQKKSDLVGTGFPYVTLKVKYSTFQNVKKFSNLLSSMDKI